VPGYTRKNDSSSNSCVCNMQPRYSFLVLIKAAAHFYKYLSWLKPLYGALWKIGIQKPLPLSMIDRYEEINQVNLINESIKYEIGSLPEEFLSGFHHG
jgi:hypothetical protein